jgi:tetratricopeptide (TPR) repeat protein
MGKRETYEDGGGFIEGAGRDVDIRRLAPAHAGAGTDLEGAMEGGSEDPVRYCERAQAHAGRGDFPNAIADYSWAIALDPDNAAAHAGRGEAYLNMKDYSRAISDYTKVIGLNPDVALGYYHRGLAYFRGNRYSQAIEDFTELVRRRPDFALAYNYRGEAYYGLKDYDRAIADYGRAIALAPNSALWYFNRGLAYSDKGDTDDAIVDFIRSISLGLEHSEICWSGDPARGGQKEGKPLAGFNRSGDHDRMARFDRDSALAYQSRGLAYFREDDCDRAIENFSQAIKLDPDLTAAYWSRSFAYLRKSKQYTAFAEADRQAAMAKE